MTFTELFMEKAGMFGAEHDNYVLPRFAVLIKEKGIRIWKQGDAIPSRGRRFLIGFVLWDRLNCEALDAMCESLKGDQLDLFMLDECKSQSDIEGFVPGVSTVFQPPVIGVWEDGRLAAKGWGWE